MVASLGDYLLRSDDGGITWVPPIGGTPNAGGTQHAYASGPDDLWVTSAGSLFTSNDAATTWQPVALPEAIAPEGQFAFDVIMSMDADGERLVVVRDVGLHDIVTGCHDRESSRLEALTSLDGGVSWTVRTIHQGWAASFVAEAGPDTFIVSVDPWRSTRPADACGSAATGFLGEMLYVSQDDGATWALSRACVEAGAGCSSASETAYGIFVGDVNGAVHHSTDGGVTYQSSQLPNAQELGDYAADYDWVMGIEVLDDGFGFAATNGGGTWRTTDGGETFMPELSAQEVQGLAIGSLAVTDRNHALAGGPNAVSRRLDIDD